MPISTTAQNLDQKFEALIKGECDRNLAANEMAHAKTAIKEKRETVFGMAEVFGANRGTLQPAIVRSMEGTV